MFKAFDLNRESPKPCRAFGALGLLVMRCLKLKAERFKAFPLYVETQCAAARQGAHALCVMRCFKKKWKRYRAGFSGVVLAISMMLTGADVQAWEGTENLVPKPDLTCIALDEVKAEFTPVDMAAAVYDCTLERRFDDAFLLRTAMVAFTVFDRERIVDRTAGQVSPILYGSLQEALRRDAPDALAEYEAYSADRFENDPLSKEDCAVLLAVGPPDYFPEYMIQHGVEASTGGQDAPLMPGFDDAAQWPWVMSVVLGCDP